MANPYLIQALYGPKPAAPTTNARGADNDQPTLQSQTLSLADKLYGRETISEILEKGHAPPERHNQAELDEKLGNSNEVANPWTPTGSNVLPLGYKSTDSNGSVSLPSLRNPPQASVTGAASGARLKSKSKSSELSIKTERGALMRNGTLRVTPAKPNNHVNASLDPRLQGKFVHTTLPAASILANSSTANSGATSYGMAALSHDTTKQMEDRLQKLEDEVLKLTMDNVLKDREIRKLKSEIAKLSGVGYETGSKRPCI